MIKISTSSFEIGIRTKSFEPQDITELDIIEDKDCFPCMRCGFLVADIKEDKCWGKGKYLCSKCEYELRKKLPTPTRYDKVYWEGMIALNNDNSSY